MLTLPNLDFLTDKCLLITGGTGSLGKKITRVLLDNSKIKKIIIFSRDEFKQFEMEKTFNAEERLRIRFFLGNVRDKERLNQAFSGVDYIIHAAALKQVPAAEYNPFEFIKTNVIGAENVISAAIGSNVKKVVALSTDKAASPINLYGATKLCSDKLFVSSNSYAGGKDTSFSVVRYGNVIGSRGSVIPFFLEMKEKGVIPITDYRMTRFWITLEQAAYFVLSALNNMLGGEIFVPKIPSMKIADLAKTIAPDCELKEIGIRPGEKLHELMISRDDARQTLEFENHFVICPIHPFWGRNLKEELDGMICKDNFKYSSDKNERWLTQESCRKIIESI